MRIRRASWEAGRGAGRKGTLHATYSEIAEALGESEAGDGYKTRAEWRRRIDGTYVAVYDYKHDEDTPLEITEWHVGGKGPEALKVLAEIFGPDRVEAHSLPRGPSPFARGLRRDR